MSDSSLRIAVVGVGAIGRRHVDYLLGDPASKALACADPDERARDFAQSRNVPWFADHATMLDAVHPHGVIIATPTALHETVAMACVEHGLPILIEKPVADTIESAQRIAAAVSRAGVAALVGHHRRHNPLLRAAREFIAGGGIGDIVSVAALDLRRKPDAYYDMRWRREAGGGPLLINGIHDVDCLRWLCGDVEAVIALTTNRTRGFAVEDSGAVTLRFANGALGTLTISDAVQAPWAWEIASGEEPDYPHQPEDTYFICGTAGALAIPTLTHWRNARGGGRGDAFLRTRLDYAPADPWLEELRHFADVIRGRAAPVTTLDDATRTLATTLAIARSAATGRAVGVNEMYARSSP